jgi:hypothetical protein
MVNYQLGKIYKLINLDTNECYIGSTCEPALARRLANHVTDYKTYLNGHRGYVSSFKIIANGNYDIVLVETYPCNNKDELHSRERYWTNEIDCVNVIKKQGIFNQLGKKEYTKNYKQDHKSEIVEKSKTYYIEHKSEILQKTKQYDEEHKEQNKNYHQKHYQDNKEEIIHKQKQYYNKHKDHLQLKNQCECGGKYTNMHKLTHEKSIKHQKYLTENNNHT